MLAMAPGSAGLDPLSVHPSDGAAVPLGLTHDTCIHVPAWAIDALANIAHTPTATRVAAILPRRPIALLLKRPEF